jgi:hypothetical protein
MHDCLTLRRGGPQTTPTHWPHVLEICPCDRSLIIYPARALPHTDFVLCFRRQSASEAHILRIWQRSHSWKHGPRTNGFQVTWIRSDAGLADIKVLVMHDAGHFVGGLLLELFGV